ncbi:MAG: hypothetical protein AAF664_08770 [Planctomycetota bacterium]
MTTRLMIVTLAAASVSGNLVLANEFDALIVELSPGNRSAVRQTAGSPMHRMPSLVEAEDRVQLHRPQPLAAQRPQNPGFSSLPDLRDPNVAKSFSSNGINAEAVSHHLPWNQSTGQCCDTQPVHREVVTCDKPLFRMPKLPKPKLRLPKLNCGSCGCGEIVDAVACSSGHCDQGAELGTCPPRQPVNLPRGSFYGVFKADRCDTGVWDGYQRRCKPIQGRSSCDGQCGEILGPRGCGCATGCDQAVPSTTCDCEG